MDSARSLKSNKIGVIHEVVEEVRVGPSATSRSGAEILSARLQDAYARKLSRHKDAEFFGNDGASAASSAGQYGNSQRYKNKLQIQTAT